MASDGKMVVDVPDYKYPDWATASYILKVEVHQSPSRLRRPEVKTKFWYGRWKLSGMWGTYERHVSLPVLNGMINLM